MSNRSRRAPLFAWCVAAIVAAIAFTYFDVATRLVHDWAADDNYSHGFLIAPIALYFCWERRGRLRSIELQPGNTGLLIVLAALGMLAVGVIGIEYFVSRLSLVVLLGGTVVFLAGWHAFRILAFPIAFLLLMIPVPAILFNHIAFPLQLLASHLAQAALNVAGVPVLREGNVIVLANTTLEVAEACSGIRSLVSLLTLAIVYGYFADDRISLRLLLAAAAIPVAIVANCVRVAGTGVAAYYVSPAAAEGFFHTFSGWVVFILAVALIVAGHQIVLAMSRDDHSISAVHAQTEQS